MKEPGRLAGDPGIELQNPDPDFWPGLGGGGGRTSLPKAGVARGEAMGDTAPGRTLEVGVEGRGPTLARGIGLTGVAGVGVCMRSSGVWEGSLPCGLPPEGSRGGGTGPGDEPGSQPSRTHTSITSFNVQPKTRFANTDQCFLPKVLLGPSASAPGW